MASEIKPTDEHVAEQLSGYVDGELTQQERQRVEVHCSECEECETTLADLRALRARVGQSQLSEFGQDKWREKMDDSAVKTSRGLGWWLMIGALAMGAVVVVFAFLADPAISLLHKVIIGSAYLGLALLLVSVLRQRMIERKSDKYKDVEI